MPDDVKDAQPLVKKTVHVHLGPHKTGSTAIQNYLSKHRVSLEASQGLTTIFGTPVSNLAEGFSADNATLVQASLTDIAARIEAASGDCIISCEDLAGDLPGRSAKKRIYPGLWQNIKRIQQAFPDASCKFYFFTRERDAWLRSAYAQHVQFRSRFNSFESFETYFLTAQVWDGVLRRSRNRLGANLIEIPYEPGPEFSSITALLHAVLGPDACCDLPDDTVRANVSPSQSEISILEAINTSGASLAAQRTARTAITVFPKKQTPSEPEDMQFPSWPPMVDDPDWLDPGLNALWTRASGRVSAQVQPIVLPDPFIDLGPLRAQTVQASDVFPAGGRADMENQVRILSYRFRGMPELCLLLGLCISYLRRDTEHTEHAAYLYQRLWAEEHAVLLGVLPTRWLISSFQTFMDHGANEAQRLAGSAAYFMANTVKTYEAERAIEGRPPGAVYADTNPTTKNGFKGMDRFQLGGTDLMLNSNALLMELAARDPVSGRVVQEFLLRLRAAKTVYSRMDESRQHHGVSVPSFTNCWSFFEEPGKD